MNFDAEKGLSLIQSDKICDKIKQEGKPRH